MKRAPDQQQRPDLKIGASRKVKILPRWGYDRIAGALANLGYQISDQTIGNILKRNGIMPVPIRKPHLSWSHFIAMHKDVITACDFFTTEVFTASGLVTFYVLFFIQIGSRKVHIAGITPHPNENWMKQIAKNLPNKT